MARRDPEFLPSAFVALAVFGHDRELYRRAWGRSVRTGTGAPMLDLTARAMRLGDPWWLGLLAGALATWLLADLLLAAWLRPAVAWFRERG